MGVRALAGRIKRKLIGIKAHNIDNQTVDEGQSSDDEPAKVLISNFEQLDAFVNDYHRRDYDANDAEFFQRYKIDIQSFKTLFGIPHPDSDPFSDEYRDWEMSFYEFLSRRKYCYEFEGAQTDLMSKIPTSCWDINTRVHYMQRYAQFLSIVNPKPGQNVFEMGFGEGNLLELFGRCRCNVFGVDASNNSADYTLKRLQSQHINAHIMHGSFFDIEKFDVAFDIVVFESSFHHCAEPLRLFKLLYDKLSPDGRVFFLHDVISDEFERPWGVRYDSESILQIRYLGWLELGYRKDFFELILHKTGFCIENIHIMRDNTQMFEVRKAGKTLRNAQDDDNESEE